MIFTGDPVSVIATSVALGAIVGVVAGAVEEGLRRRRAQMALQEAARADRDRAIATDDPKELHDYLVQQIGAMSVRDFAEDVNARRFVAKAAERAQGFLDASATETLSHLEHLDAAQALIEKGEVPGGLARLRLAIEQALDAVRESDGRTKRTPGEVLRRISNTWLPEPAAEQLRHALRTANRGLHGETVSQPEALEAWRAARDGLRTADKKLRGSKEP